MIIAATDRTRAPYACHPSQSRGRRFPQADSAMRNAFQRDRDRVIHSAAFRRLKGKTQVFVAHEGDLYRTRLTHSLEVSQIARTLARALRGDEDLAEALALAHDLGHPPFGHEGERELALKMKDFGGFDHNAQTLRAITKLEVRYPEFDGLNLTWETLEGVVKHNGPLLGPGQSEADLPWAFTDYDGWRDLEFETHAGLEAQIAALADDIAYNNHDIDDGLSSGLLEMEPLLELPLVGDIFRRVRDRWPDKPQTIIVHEAVRELIGVMVADVLEESGKRLDRARPDSAQALRELDHPVVAFSEEMVLHLAALRRHLFAHMYRHYKVNRMMSQARRVTGDLFDLYLSNPGVLPSDVQAGMTGAGTAQTARAVCDYIAGMTDRFAVEEHRRLFTVQGYF
ncbi:deoxyguanosinetriphosphate triphosphohydrolase [Maricaulis sp.]|uniref:deoxyguanosinetriphosphate triphosphohydrolase n=1 Tax=Maricaulis sp. TaxID=1486257 RepID=UPI002B27B860|nr:deoxyguanosinetriphosphate triphosphohydrolase [Maricaulis sp.]